MVKDTCLRTGFVQGYQTPDPKSSCTQHLLLIIQVYNKHDPQNIIRNSTPNSIKTCYKFY